MIAKERTPIGTLKALGFRDRQIIRHYAGYAAMVGVIGLAGGVAALDYLLQAMAGEYEMHLAIGPVTYCVSILLTCGVSVLVSLLVGRKNRKINMVEALKGTE
ncbi:MAG: ABC transporter permease [Oscillospiraceae bacterium]|nr:ABC transporter permease [Oscillospiraceae bacterium]